MTKILIFSHEFPPDVGGAGIVASQNAKLLHELGYDVTVLTKHRVKLLDLKYTIVYIETFKRLYFLSYRPALDYNKFDLIFLNDQHSIYTAGLFFSKDLLSKCVCFLHGSEPEEIFEDNNWKKKMILFKHFFTRSLLYSRYIVAPSIFMKEKFVTRTKINLIANKIIVFYYGIDSSIFYRQYHDLKSEIGISSSSILILSVSRLVEKKGYVTMVGIFKKLIAMDMNVYWIIIGSGPYKDKIETLVKSEKLEEYVLFLNNMSRNELVRYYSSVDCFWLLSEYEESFGLVYVEAQMCGCPAIGYNKSGVREAVDNNRSGFLVDSEEECIDIFRNRKINLLKKNDILNFAKKFRARDQIFKLMNILEGRNK